MGQAALGDVLGKGLPRNRVDLADPANDLVDLILLEVADHVERDRFDPVEFGEARELTHELLGAILGKVTPARAPGGNDLGDVDRLGDGNDIDLGDVATGRRACPGDARQNRFPSALGKAFVVLHRDAFHKSRRPLHH